MISKNKSHLSVFWRSLFLLGTVIFSSIIIISACGTTSGTISEETANSIPEGSTKVIVTSAISQDSLYNESIKALNKEGFIIQKTAKDLYQLSAKYAMAEEGTDINVNIIVRSELNGSSAVITGIWFVGQARQQKAAWIEERYQLWKYSFALMGKVAQQMNGTIKYAK